MRYLKAVLTFPILIMILTQITFAGTKEPTMHTVMADGHPMALWEKSIPNPKGHIILHHGRTWSSLPDFDLQVEGEELSLMDSFNEMGYSVWALDARGYGKTPRDETGWNTPDRAAKDLSIVLQWLRDKNGDKTHVWGWSLGSMITQLTAQKYPDNMKSITLFGYPVRSNDQIPEDMNSGVPPSEPTTAEAAASDFIVPGSISQKAIDEYIRHSLEVDPVRSDWNKAHEWNQLDASKVTLPVLLLQGELDPLTSTEFHANVFSAFPNANKQWVVLKGGDHAALLEKPRVRLVDASINFIEWIEK